MEIIKIHQSLMNKAQIKYRLQFSAADINKYY